MRREPVCVLGERVWRTYLGGREIGKIHGDEKAEDSHFPEEWMYSVTRAFNAGREEICEGLCKIAGEECFFKQDYDRMLGLMNCLEVKPGETYLVKGGVPHAIGAGCTLIEIQEPTDYTIRVEKVTPSGYTIDDSMFHQGLGFEKMFECFHYVGAGETATREDDCIRERTLENGGRCLVGYEDTPCFKMEQYTVEKGETKEFKEEEVFSCLYILSGKGILKTETKEYQIERNSQFFVPAGGESYSIINTGETKIQLLKMYGPQD